MHMCTYIHIPRHKPHPKNFNHGFWSVHTLHGLWTHDTLRPVQLLVIKQAWQLHNTAAYVCCAGIACQNVSVWVWVWIDLWQLHDTAAYVCCAGIACQNVSVWVWVWIDLWQLHDTCCTYVVRQNLSVWVWVDFRWLHITTAKECLRAQGSQVKIRLSESESLTVAHYHCERMSSCTGGYKLELVCLTLSLNWLLVDIRRVRSASANVLHRQVLHVRIHLPETESSRNCLPETELLTVA